jgi:hypothetical protein
VYSFDSTIPTLSAIQGRNGITMWRLDPDEILPNLLKT